MSNVIWNIESYDADPRYSDMYSRIIIPPRNGKTEMQRYYREFVNSMYGGADFGSSIYIKDVIFNDPATIVFWTDSTKTVVKCQEGDEFDPEKGLTMAIVKKIYGNKGSYCNEIKKWCEPYYEKQKEKDNLVARICDPGKKASAALAALEMAETAIAEAKEREEKKHKGRDSE